MDLLGIIILTLQITHIQPRKYLSSSDESIENVVYYKDCKYNKKVETTEAPVKLRASLPTTPKPPECPYPRMCCTLTCGGKECESQQSFVSRQMQPLQQGVSVAFPSQPQLPPQPQPRIPVQPKIKPNMRKKKPKLPNINLPPINGRRDSGFTKEKIKSLISQDDDIRKILKDLVRVTMQKVDVMELINSKKDGVTTESANIYSNEDYIE